MDNSVFLLHRDLEQRHWWFQGRLKVVSSVINSIHAGQSSSFVVDVGCGTGGTVAHLSRSLPCVGIDVSPVAIDIARGTYPECTFFLGEIGDMRELFQRTSTILVMDVIEHVADDRGFLKSVVDLARPAAHILITVPAEPALWSRHDVTAGHFRRYVPDALAALWSDLPVTTRLLTYFNTRLYPIIRAIRAAGQRTGRASGSCNTDFAMPPRPLNWLLTQIFGAEARAVVRCIDQPRSGPGRKGVSLIAMLQKV